MSKAQNLAALIREIADQVETLEHLRSRHAHHVRKIRNWLVTVTPNYDVGSPSEYFLERINREIGELARTDEQLVQKLASLTRSIVEAADHA